MDPLNEKGPRAVAAAQRANTVSVGKQTHHNKRKFGATANEKYVRPVIHAHGPGGVFTARGQTAKALTALVTAGARGVTALEVNSWAFRLGAYMHSLRHDCGLAIETLRESHSGGWHGRYVLRSPVKLEPVK